MNRVVDRRKFIHLVGIGGVGSLGGCATFGGGPQSITQVKVNNQKVREHTVAIIIAAEGRGPVFFHGTISVEPMDEVTFEDGIHAGDSPRTGIVRVLLDNGATATFTVDIVVNRPPISILIGADEIQVT